jgi:uncharacterized protein involved in exopolysaccharide biosynthesis
MSTPSSSKSVRFSAHVYERLLRAYPRGHREEYGPCMAQLFRDQCRDAWAEARNWALLKLWLRVLPDLLATSLLEHFSNLNQRKSMLNRVLSGRALAAVFVFLAVFFLVFISSILITFILPETYSATARIKVERDTPSVQLSELDGQKAQEALKNSPPIPSGYDPYFIQTEFEVLQSEVILGRVVESLELNKEWGLRFGGGEPLKTAESVELLKRMIDLRPVRNTTVIEIRAFSNRPEEAAKLANGIAEAYKTHRLDQSRERVLADINALEERWKECGVQIRAAQEKLAKSRDKLKVPVPEPAESVLAANFQPYADAKQRLEDQRQYRALLGMKIAQQQTELSLPKTSMVQIIDQAIANPLAVRPNKPLNIALGAVLGVVLGAVAGGGIAGISFLSGRGYRTKPGNPKSAGAAL